MRDEYDVIETHFRFLVWLLTVPASSPAAPHVGRARLPPGALPPPSFLISIERKFSLVRNEGGGI